MRYGKQHGREHGGAGSDPILADWHYVGASGEPAFQNGWDNVGDPKAPLRFRYMPGVDPDTLQPSIKIEGSVTGGTAGTAIFTLPITLDYDTYHLVADDTGTPLTITVQQSGDVVDGFV